MGELYTRREFLKLASVTMSAAVLAGEWRLRPLDASFPSISFGFQVDKRLITEGRLSIVELNRNFPDPEKLLRDAWWKTAQAALERTTGEKVSVDEYKAMVRNAVMTGDHASLMFSVGGTDKRISNDNFSTFKVDPLQRIKVGVTGTGWYKRQLLGMQLDSKHTVFAQDDTLWQSKVTDINHKQFGFAKDTDGQLVMIFNWDPSRLSRYTMSAQLTDRFVDTLLLLAYRSPATHNMHSLLEEEGVMLLQKGYLYRSLFGLDSQGKRIGLLTAREFKE